MARPADAGKRTQSDPSSYLSAHRARSSSNTSATEPGRGLFRPGSAPTPSSKRAPTGTFFVHLDGYSLDLGWFSAAAAKRVLALHKGLPPQPRWDPAPDHRIARSSPSCGDWPGMVCWNTPLGHRATRTRSSSNRRSPDYWPQTPPLGNAEVLALSRFAYLRRRGDAMVLELPRAGALFRICDPKIATALALLSTPQQVGRLRRQAGFPGIELLALLVDCQILFKVDAAHDGNLRPAEGDADLVLWDFHDLLFHARSTPGRHANPLGGAYPYAAVTPAPPAVRRRWPGEAIDLRPLSGARCGRFANRAAAA